MLSQKTVVASPSFVAMEKCSSRSVKYKYTVIWGRITTKLRKTYEHDGTLEVSERTMVLKDLKGKYIAAENFIKREELEAGQQITVGDKELQIVNEIKEQDENGIIEEEVEEGQEFILPKQIKQEKEERIKQEPIEPEISPNDETLIMPDPPVEHQWAFNHRRRPLAKVRVQPQLAAKLRPHQKEGVIFLYENLMGFRNTEHNDQSFYGAILADEMGLGKTLQCITLCHTLLKSGPYGEPIARKILVDFQ